MSQSSLDDWIRAAWPRAVVYARSLLSDRAAAEDVVQECFCNLLRKADVYDLPRDGVPLLMKSISRACLKLNTRGLPMASLNGATTIDPADTGALEPPKVVLHAELEWAVAEALEQLPPMQRAAVELKGLGHSLQEIAEILEVSATNAGVLVHRGRQNLAERLAPFLEKSDVPGAKRSTD
jgi:RNA polymerase sigma-70 factor (ECF subfamily)